MHYYLEAIIIAIGLACVGGGIKAGLDNFADALRKVAKSIEKTNKRLDDPA